jgi:hypothetical protein
MNWFQQNRFAGGFLAALALATFLSGYFLLHEKGVAGDQQSWLDATLAELTLLRQGNPFPNDKNLRKMKVQTESYRSAVLALENELKTRTSPVVALQPNEFQAQLRQATTAIVEQARISKVRLPENFYLGFDEYATSLPNSTAAPLLGRQLKAVEWLANTIVEAHVDSLNSLSRAPLKEEAAPSATLAKTRPIKPGKPMVAARGLVEANSVDLAFSASPAATRKILNQIASASEQFLIVRTLVVKNQVMKGPPRGAGPEAATASNPSRSLPAGGKAGTFPATAAISFIVGTEHIDVAAKIEIVQFNFPQKEIR